MRLSIAASIVAVALAASALAQDASEETLRSRVEAAQGAERAQANADFARFLEGQGRWSEASAAWRDARKLRGGLGDVEGEARALLAFAEDVRGSGENGSAVAAAYEDAKTALRRARDAGSRSIDVALGLARCAEVANDAAGRLAVLADAAAAHPDDLRVARTYAAALRAAGRASDALAVLEKLADAHLAEIALDLAAAAKDAGDEPTAVSTLKRAAGAAPEDFHPWQALWTLFAAKQRWGELADATTSVADAHKESGTAAHYAGMACVNARRFDQALALLERAWTLKDYDHDARLAAARILLTEKHDRPAALALYRRVIDADPKNVAAHDGIFRVAKRVSDEGDPAGAAELFALVAKARPDDGQSISNWALALRWAGKYAEAEGAYLSAIAANAKDPQIRNDFGLLLLVERRTEDAKRVFLAAHEVDPANNDSMENLGFVARAAGQRDEALKWFRMAWRAQRERGEDGSRHRITVDDQRWPLPPLPAR